jgi:hypothetical protein
MRNYELMLNLFNGGMFAEEQIGQKERNAFLESLVGDKKLKRWSCTCLMVKMMVLGIHSW